MAAKPDKENPSSKKDTPKKEPVIKKTNIKLKKPAEDEDLEDEEAKPVKGGKKALLAKSDEEDEIDDLEDDDVVKAEADEDWDPDFAEFDLPKSSKKVTGGKKAAKEEDDDFKIDDEFKDLFGSKSSKHKDDDDY